jgi:hypothetical protein
MGNKASELKEEIFEKTGKTVGDKIDDIKRGIVTNVADSICNKYGKDILEKADKMINAKLGYKGGKDILEKAKNAILDKMGEKSCQDVAQNYGT